ncbi:MAG: hypothetical protein GW912_07030 [Zetaproteobacteria bacterium]|nr:hypothetical protein [Flavobacteriales bacterium]
MKLQDFKYSYNRFYKIYRVELFEHGNWRKCTYNKKNFEFLIANNLKTKNEIRNFPYKPYFLHIIKWSFMNIWQWINNLEPKVKKIKENAIIGIIFLLLGYLIKNCESTRKTSSQVNSTTNYEQELILKEQTIQNYEAFSDFLLREIKKKELTIKDFELARPKGSILKNGND